MSIFKKLARAKKRLVIALAGQTAYRVFNYFVDFVFCPALILWLGIIWGSATYMAFTLVLDLASIIFYNRVKVDVLGLELGKELRGWMGERLLRSRGKISDLPLGAKLFLVFALTLMMSPFQVVVFMRQANEYREKMSSEEYLIFWASYVGGNLYWVLLVSGTVELGKFFF